MGHMSHSESHMVVIFPKRSTVLINETHRTNYHPLTFFASHESNYYIPRVQILELLSLIHVIQDQKFICLHNTAADAIEQIIAFFLSGWVKI